MGFNAFVICRCYQDGKTEEPPGKEYVKFDSDGLYIDVPNNIDKEQRWELEDKFDKWRSSACPHKEMELCCEHLSNNQGMYDFINMLIEKKGYPILSECLPRVNGGMMLPEQAKDCRDELERLESMDLSQIKIQLHEVFTPKLLMDVDKDHNRTFILTAYNKRNCVLSEDGFIITENKTKSDGETLRYIVFQSKHFTVQKVRKFFFNKKPLFRYTDIDTGKRYECDINLDSENLSPSKEFVVSETALKIIDEYSYIIEPLRKLIRASLDTGNPIHWC